MKKRNSEAKALERKTFQQQIIAGKKHVPEGSDFLIECPECKGTGDDPAYDKYEDAEDGPCPWCGGCGEVNAWR